MSSFIKIWNPEYPGNLNYLWRILEFKCTSFNNCAIFNQKGMNGVLQELSAKFNDRLGMPGKIYTFSLRSETFTDVCNKCPCTMKKDLCSNEAIFLKV